MSYPMYCVSINDLLEMNAMEPNQVLLQKGVLKKWRPGMRCIFVSHQWLSGKHPDPELKQFHCLQEIFRKFLRGDFEKIGLRIWQQQMFPEAAKQCLLEAAELKNLAEESYIWLDYFSIPQTSYVEGLTGEALDAAEIAAGAAHSSLIGESNSSSLMAFTLDGLQKAVNSIPAYVESSEITLALNPWCVHSDTGDLCDHRSWRLRGWCRLEFQSAVLSRRSGPILIAKSASELYFSVPIDAYRLHVGSGKFSCCAFNHKIGDTTIECDKFKCKRVLQCMLCSKLEHLKGQGEEKVDEYRRFRAVRHSIFDDLPEEDDDLAKAGGDDPEDLEGFLNAYGFDGTKPEQAIVEGRKTGWSPLRYAVMSRNVKVVRALLDSTTFNKKLDLESPLKRALPVFFREAGMTVLMEACATSSPEIIGLLLDAGADAYAFDRDHVVPKDPLGNAVMNSRPDVVRFWFERFPQWNVNRAITKGNAFGNAGSLLHAAHFGGYECTKALLQERPGAEKPIIRWHDLMCGLVNDESDVECVNLLVESGYMVNTVPRYPHASQRFMIGTVVFNLFNCCMSKKSKENMDGGMGACVLSCLGGMPSVLFVTAFDGHISGSQRLIDAGVDTKATNRLGWDHIEVARRNGRTAYVQYFTTGSADMAAIRGPEAPKLVTCGGSMGGSQEAAEQELESRRRSNEGEGGGVPPNE